jgi:hypothetical protein
MPEKKTYFELLLTPKWQRKRLEVLKAAECRPYCRGSSE